MYRTMSCTTFDFSKDCDSRLSGAVVEKKLTNIRVLNVENIFEPNDKW